MMATQAQDAPSARAGSQIGRSVARLEARDKVTGRTEYTHTMRLPGMLVGKIFRSTIAHGRIRRIDTRAARQLPGVHSVVTGEDILRVIPNPYYGPVFHDQPILAIDKVRFVGEPVAVVLASDPHVAEEAAQLIIAEYEELPAVFDEVEAMTAQVYVHDELKPAPAFPDLRRLAGRRNTNVALDFRLRRGDVEPAFASAAHVFAHEFRTQKVLHVALEPFASLADFKDDRLTIHTASQSPSFVRSEIARLLGWPENRVRVKVPSLGGGYGAKLYIKLEALAAALSLLARAPVKIALGMDEVFYQVTRHPVTFRIKSGVNKDGRIVARQCEVLWNGGAYADIGPRITQRSGAVAAGPYDIENLAVDSYAIYTNLVPAGALRGFGVPQMVWAYESHTDMIARALAIDPLELRRRNILRAGRPQAAGTPMRDAAIEAVLERLAERMNWGKPFARGEGRVRRGRGIAIGFKSSIAGTTSVATVMLFADGSCVLHCGTVDMGQGSDTVMAQIVGEVLNLPAEAVVVAQRDTDATPYDMGTLGSRSLFHMGHAVRRAAEEVRDKLKAMAREVGEPEGSNISVADLFRKKYGAPAGAIVGSGAYKSDFVPPDAATGQTPDATPFWMIAGTGVEVEVDTETGHVKVDRLVSVADVGTPINPRIVETQLSGGALMQLGITLFEKMQLDGGQVTNASLADYRIPGIFDVPAAMESITVESRQSNGPFGAKGVGELGTFGVSPAIANAIDDAVGVRLVELPLTPEAVLRALRAKASKPLKE